MPLRVLGVTSEELRREINDGPNVVEQWNGANDFVFFARRGEMTSNRREDREISMLALHLLQNCHGLCQRLDGPANPGTTSLGEEAHRP
jgi:hypothetical protein